MLRHTADTRRLAYSLVTAVALAFALQWGAKFFIPLCLGIVAAYTLNPLVQWLERQHVHRLAAATLVVAALVGGGSLLAVSIEGQVETILTQLPAASHRLKEYLDGRPADQPGLLQRLKQVEQAMESQQDTVAAPATGSRKGPLHVIVDATPFHLGDLMWEGSRSAAGIAVQMTMVVFLVYFLLLSGDSFKRKLVRLTGRTLTSKKITVQILDDINYSIQRYMLALFWTNLVLALLCWCLFTWTGLQNASAWALAAGFVHVIPYFGTVLIAVLTGGAALAQSGSWPMTLEIVGGAVLISFVVGTLVNTWMTGRITRMNPVAIFVALLFWSWLWGVWGALLAVPITGVIKVICHRVEQFTPLAEFLAE